MRLILIVFRKIYTYACSLVWAEKVWIWMNEKSKVLLDSFYKIIILRINAIRLIAQGKQF